MFVCLFVCLLGCLFVCLFVCLLECLFVCLFVLGTGQQLYVIIDDRLTMEKHISNICRASSFGLHKIGQIRQYLDQSTTEKLIHAFVISRIDNYNSLLYGLPESQLQKLQRVQNSAARLITRTRSLQSFAISTGYLLNHG